MINPLLKKSFKNIMYQQEKMDNKAYIFIGIIGFIFSIFFSAEKSSLIFNYIANDHSVYMILIYLASIIIPLVFSLVPIATKSLVSIMNKLNEVFFKKTGKDKSNFNIFYYIYFYNFSKDEFIDLFKSNYDIKKLSKADIYLIDQIIINAKILKTKIIFHTISQFITFLIILINLLSVFSIY